MPPALRSFQLTVNGLLLFCILLIKNIAMQPAGRQAGANSIIQQERWAAFPTSEKLINFSS